MTEQVAHEKKLGRGLSALLGDNKSKLIGSLSTNSGDIVEKISVEKIVAGIYQPRQSFPQNEIIELAESIKEKV